MAPARSCTDTAAERRNNNPRIRTVRSVDLILRAEAIAIFVAGVLAYLQLNGHPLWLLPLLLAPDVLVHNLATALVILAIGWFAAIAALALTGAIFVAHVGMDRSLGYGLKLPTDFKDTHLGRIGR